MKSSIVLAAAPIVREFALRGEDPGEGASPEELVEALEQCADQFERIAAAGPGAVAARDVTDLGDQALVCVIDLTAWAEVLGMRSSRPAVEACSLPVADWIVGHGGELCSLEPVVNALAAGANETADPEALARLCARSVGYVRRVAVDARGLPGDRAADHPWPLLLANTAIIATRSQREALMREAFGLLEAHLPENCPSFFAEGLEQSRKPVYGEVVRLLMHEHFTKWTTRH